LFSIPVLSIRRLLVALVALLALYLDFVIYQTGGTWLALGLLVVIGLFLYIYLDDRASTYRYLFPGFAGFGLFVIFPLVYTVWVSLTRYSSSNLLPYHRALEVFKQETYPSGAATYTYQLLLQPDGRFRVYLVDQSDPSNRFVSEPIDLKPGKEMLPGE
jgi:maltose/maltodextrin transport system permease protein